jgi:hypothetical protein
MSVAGYAFCRAPKIQLRSSGDQGDPSPHSHFGNSQKNIFKKWKRITTKNHVPKSPQSAVNPPQTHHEFTIKNHHIFANPLQKDPAKPQKLRSEKNHAK